METSTMFHFLPSDRRLRYGDGREVRVGETLTTDEAPVLCESGLHACRRMIDALGYAPGPVLTVVTLGGTVIHGDDKSAGTERACLWMLDCDRLLREFACDVAEIALTREREAGREPDPRSWAAASAAARAAASAAAWDAASAAAWDAAWDAFDKHLLGLLVKAGMPAEYAVRSDDSLTKAEA